MEELLIQLRQFAKERDWEQFHSPKNLSMALIVEAAEIVEHFQWISEAQSASISGEKIEQIKEEIGDTLIYLIMLADKLHINPIEAAIKKINKNKIKYPAERVSGKSKKYNEYNEDRNE